jgi:1,4-dihydroxy-2-naphthoate octaprenyltransferase
MKPNPFLIFLKLSRPHFLLITFGQVILGTGIAYFLDREIDWQLFALGLGWLFSLQLGTHYLIQYFTQTSPQKNNLPKAFTFYPGILGEGVGQLPRRVALGSAAGMLTIVTIFTLGIAQFGDLNPSLIIVMGLIFLLSLSFALPIVNFSESGLAELIFALLTGILLPGFSFLLQAGGPNRVFILVTVPLAILLIPVILSLEFPNYSISDKYSNHNLIHQLGWQSAMSLHNSFILIAFLILGVTALMGMPLRTAFSPFIAFPLALLQIWQMRQIASGVKPNWRTLTWNAVVIFELVAYLLTFSFWLA